MTLEEAVEVLNRHRHRDHSEWSVEECIGGPPLFILGRDRHEWLIPFEVFAIAEKYERDRAAGAKESGSDD